MVKPLKILFYKMAEALGVLSYTHEQNYRFKYCVSLKNKSSEPQKFFLVLPIASDRLNQKLLTKVEFLPHHPHVKTDVIFKNKYALWQGDLKPLESRTYEESFDIKVFPQRLLAIPKQSISDYSEIDPYIKEQFCHSNHYIQSDHKKIVQLAHRIKGKKTDVLKIVRAINRFVVDYLDYKNPILGIYTSIEALEKKEVDCGGFDTFFVALCNALGIPARVVSGFWTGSEKGFSEKNLMHAWAEFMLPDGQWIAVDPATEQLYTQGRTRKSGKFGFVGSDRVVFSYGCDIPLLIEGKEIFTDILQNPFVYPQNVAEKLEITIDCTSERKKV